MTWKLLVRRIIRKLYTIVNYSRFNRIGKNVTFEPFSSLMNPGYISIGDECYVGPNCRIEAWNHYLQQEFSPEIVLGNDVRINSRCHIGAITSVRIEECCLLGSGVFITDHSHGAVSIDEAQLHPSNRPLFSKGDVVIGRNTWVGENAVILPGVHIGECCVIGAAAVVTKSVPPYSVVAGNPARVVRRLIENN